LESGKCSYRVPWIHQARADAGFYSISS